MLTCLDWLTHLIVRLVSFLDQAWLHLTQPARRSLVLGTAADLTRRFVFSIRASLACPPGQSRQELAKCGPHLQVRHTPALALSGFSVVLETQIASPR